MSRGKKKEERNCEGNYASQVKACQWGKYKTYSGRIDSASSEGDQEAVDGYQRKANGNGREERAGNAATVTGGLGNDEEKDGTAHELQEKSIAGR